MLLLFPFGLDLQLYEYTMTSLDITRIVTVLGTSDFSEEETLLTSVLLSNTMFHSSASSVAATWSLSTSAV